MIAFLFWLLVIASCGYAAAQGSRDGRWIAGFYFSAILLTVPAQLIQQNWVLGTNWPVFIVDLYQMGGLYWLSMRARSYWPLWVVGFQVGVLTSHLATLVTPTYAFRLYFLLATLWSIPQLLVMIVGVTLDRRAGIITDDSRAQQRSS